MTFNETNQTTSFAVLKQTLPKSGHPSTESVIQQDTSQSKATSPMNEGRATPVSVLIDDADDPIAEVDGENGSSMINFDLIEVGNQITEPRN